MSTNNSTRISKSSLRSYKQIVKNCTPIIVKTTKELNSVIDAKVKEYQENKKVNKRPPGFIVSNEILDDTRGLSYGEVYVLDLDSKSDKEYTDFLKKINADPYLGKIFSFSQLTLDDNTIEILIEIAIETVNK